MDNVQVGGDEMKAIDARKIEMKEQDAQRSVNDL